MRSSNPTALALGLVFAGLMVLTYLWTHRFAHPLRYWATFGWSLGCCAAGLYLWWHGVAVRFTLADIPTSSIGSAAQGYVELFGKACRSTEVSPHELPLYLWKRTEFAERASLVDFRLFPFNFLYIPVRTEVTDQPFGIRDASGTAIILPQDAEVICADRRVTYGEDARRTDEYIREGEPLYVVGLFMTHEQSRNIDAEVERLMLDWKMDPRMRTRFDTNRDGYLSGKELIAMHRAARAQVLAAAKDPSTAATLHTVSRPTAGQRFVISTLTPEQLAGHYEWYLIGGLVLFFAGLAGAVMLYLGRPG
jgi:hypothetical protein